MDHPAFRDIQRSLRKAWVLQQLVWMGVLIVSLMTTLLGSGLMAFLSISGGLCSIVALGVLQWNGPFRQSPLLRCLQHQPTEIVWVYGFRLTRAPLGIVLSNLYRIYFQTRDRQRMTLDIPEHRYLVVMKWLNRVMPHVEFGWNEERFKKWQNGGYHAPDQGKVVR